MDPLAFYKCLAEETRLKSLLLISEKKELCVCDLMQALQLSQPKISRHLAELRKCGILIDERRGRWVYYQLNPALPNWVNTVLITTAKAESQFIAEEIKQLTCDQGSC